jgi:hypothetical protein
MLESASAACAMLLLLWAVMLLAAAALLLIVLCAWIVSDMCVFGEPACPVIGDLTTAYITTNT